MKYGGVGSSDQDPAHADTGTNEPHQHKQKLCYIVYIVLEFKSTELFCDWNIW